MGFFKRLFLYCVVSCMLCDELLVASQPSTSSTSHQSTVHLSTPVEEQPVLTANEAEQPAQDGRQQSYTIPTGNEPLSLEVNSSSLSSTSSSSSYQQPVARSHPIRHPANHRPARRGRRIMSTSSSASARTSSVFNESSSGRDSHTSPSDLSSNQTSSLAEERPMRRDEVFI